MKEKLQSLRSVAPILAILLLAACDARTIAYKGTCGQQSQQFLDYIYAFVTDELTPMINDGFIAGPSANLMMRIDEFDARISDLNTPECNPRTQAVKEALRLYLYETRSYFMVVAGRAVYGEGQVQAHRGKMYEAGLAFEIAFADVRK